LLAGVSTQRRRNPDKKHKTRKIIQKRRSKTDRHKSMFKKLSEVLLKELLMCFGKHTTVHENSLFREGKQ